MKNLFNYFMNNVLQMAHEDPPTGNGGTGTGNNSGGVDDTEDLKNGTENPDSGKGGESTGSSGGQIDDEGRPLPDVGLGIF